MEISFFHITSYVVPTLVKTPYINDIDFESLLLF
jgi:hypothetical protein